MFSDAHTTRLPCMPAVWCMCVYVEETSSFVLPEGNTHSSVSSTGDGWMVTIGKPIVTAVPAHALPGSTVDQRFTHKMAGFSMAAHVGEWYAIACMVAADRLRPLRIGFRLASGWLRLRLTAVG